VVNVVCVVLVLFFCRSHFEHFYFHTNRFGQVKILLSFVQIFSSMPGVLDAVPWPTSFVQFALPLNIFNLDLLSAFSTTSCGLNVRFYDKFILHMLLPIGCVLVLLLAYVISKRVMVIKNKKNGGLTKEKKNHLDQTASKAGILIMLLLYPGLSTKIFTLFKCKSIPGIEGQLLVEDFTQKCGAGEHVTYSILGMVCLLLFVLGIPIGMFLLLYTVRKHLHDETSEHHVIVRNALGGMYLQCK